NPANRYESALALADDLSDIRKGRSPRKARPFTWQQKTWRKIRKNWKIPVAIAASICIIWVIWAIYSSGNRPPDFDRSIRDAQAKLAKGESVELIAGTGLPIGYQVRAGADTNVWRESDGTATVTSHGFALVEIMPDPMRESYNFRV